MHEIDEAVRLFVYRHFVEMGRAPSVPEVAAGLDRPAREVEDAFRRLDQAHVLVLTPGSSDIWMAMPFSALPTQFLVDTPERSWWANCAWDALGIPAMLDQDAEIRTSCGDCEEPLNLTIKQGSLVETEGVIHFAVPAARWWDDVGFT